MIPRITFSVALGALLLISSIAGAQRASIAAGAVVPLGDNASTAGMGLDLDLQVRTEPMIGALALRLDVTYDRFAAKGGVSETTFSSQTASLLGDLGSNFYWMAGAGYYQSSAVMQISGHNLPDQRQYLGAQGALGVNIPMFRREGFLEVGGVRLFTQGTSKIYMPLRFGIRL